MPKQKNTDKPSQAAQSVYRTLKTKSPELVPETLLNCYAGGKENAIKQSERCLKPGERMEYQDLGKGTAKVRYYRIVTEES